MVMVNYLCIYIDPIIFSLTEYMSNTSTLIKFWGSMSISSIFNSYSGGMISSKVTVRVRTTRDMKL